MHAPEENLVEAAGAAVRGARQVLPERLDTGQLTESSDLRRCVARALGDQVVAGALSGTERRLVNDELDGPPLGFRLRADADAVAGSQRAGLHRLADPEARIGGELDAPLRVEALDGPDQPDHALLEEVRPLDLGAGQLRRPHVDEAKVGHHGVHGEVDGPARHHRRQLGVASASMP